ncbi:unnamed protein product, partial [Mesorhabditis belari]|uniref:B9 domain-containing protein 2 n=1 Tax=Mesorhabditis belari TaxID=2138241 RepID=A0AAF3FPW0_9BILA
MVEVFYNGIIESASDFEKTGFCVRWKLHIGGGWRVIEGAQEGQTQTDLAKSLQKAYFLHPIDIHLATRTLQDWPKLMLEVWHCDEYGRQEIYGYGSIFLPSLPGHQELECHIWRPKGTLREELMQKFIGGGLQLTESLGQMKSFEVAKFDGKSAGIIKLQMNTITRNFDRFGIVA